MFIGNGRRSWERNAGGGESVRQAWPREAAVECRLQSQPAAAARPGTGTLCPPIRKSEGQQPAAVAAAADNPPQPGQVTGRHAMKAVQPEKMPAACSSVREPARHNERDAAGV